ncbi:MAG: HAD-IIIA family hydrolase [Caulobacter sp.]|nr:HAD-IIIA family hydrolase [Caulobacter sp.]
MITQAVVLVGGLGTRLGELTKETPKPLLEVGGRPFLHWLLLELRRHGITDILLLAGFRADRLDRISEAFPEVRVIVEPEPLGTGGALRHAAEHLDPRFFFLNGDSFFDINLWDLALGSKDAVGVLALRPVEDVSRYGPATLEGDLIRRFAERPETDGPGLINGGVAVLSRTILDHLAAEQGPVSIEREVYPRLAEQGLLGGRIYERPFIDIGVPEDFARAQDFVPNTMHRGAVVFDRDGLFDHEVNDAHRPDQIEWAEGAVAAIKEVNDAGLFAFVTINQAGKARGYDEGAVTTLHAWINAELKARGAHIDSYAYSSHHPEAYRGASHDHGLDPGTILDLVTQFPVVRERTAMIGDRPSDVAAAEAAGIIGLLFERGDLSVFLRPWITRLAAG